MRAGVITILVAIVCVLSCAAPALANTSLNKYEKQLVALINKQRAKRDLAKVSVNVHLVKAARSHSAEMGTQKFFAHDSADGERWSSRIVRYGYKRRGCSLWRAGENIYYGSGIYSSPRLVMKAWMSSPLHRRIILTKAFRDIGIGAVKTTDGFGSVDGTVWFFTLDLGRRITS